MRAKYAAVSGVPSGSNQRRRYRWVNFRESGPSFGGVMLITVASDSGGPRFGPLSALANMWHISRASAYYLLLTVREAARTVNVQYCEVRLELGCASDDARHHAFLGHHCETTIFSAVQSYVKV